MLILQGNHLKITVNEKMPGKTWLNTLKRLPFCLLLQTDMNGTLWPLKLIPLTCAAIIVEEQDSEIFRKLAERENWRLYTYRKKILPNDNIG